MSNYKLTVCTNEDCYKSNQCATNIKNKKLTKKQLGLKSTLKILPNAFTNNSRCRMCWFFNRMED